MVLGPRFDVAFGALLLFGSAAFALVARVGSGGYCPTSS